MIGRDFTSSVLKSATFDWDARILQLVFKDGQVYDYRKVPPSLFVRLIHATSAGQFYNRHIRGRFQASRIDLPTDTHHEHPTPQAG